MLPNTSVQMVMFCFFSYFCFLFYDISDFLYLYASFFSFPFNSLYTAGASKVTDFTLSTSI